MWLYSGKIQDNITLGVDDYDDKFLVEISKASGVMDWLSKLPNGFDYELSEGGKELSGGQKQTVALARALMRKPNYLLFDEPTANMDTGTEQQVLAGLKEHLTNETMLIVTHRMAPLSLVDRIIVLDNGRVAGWPRDLVIQNFKQRKQLKINASLYSKHSIIDYFDYLTIFLVIWSNLVVLDELSRVQGVVIPSSKEKSYTI